ncbi:MAG: TlpA disulfide reductase family protein [Candidatus Eisenbacteria bacterium]
MRFDRPGFPLLILLGAALLAPAGTSAPAGASKIAGDFSLPDLNGKTIHLAEINAEHPVLVSFWATWCVPCPQEMQHLQRFHEQYGAKGLQILAISIDGPKTVSQVKPFVTGRRFTLPVLLDTNNDVKRLYQVSAVPSVCLLKPGRELAFHHVGYKPGDEIGLEREIRAVLGLGDETPAADDSTHASGAEADSADARGKPRP